MKITRIAAVFLASALVFAASSVAPAEEKLVLKQRYLPGTHLMTTTMTIDQTITANNVAQPPQHIEQLMVTRLVVGQPDAQGNKKMSITYDRYKQEMKIDSQVISYDSAGPAEKQNPALAQVLSVLNKMKVEVTVDKDDTITKVSGSDKTWDELARQNELLKPMLQKIKGQLGDAMIMEMFKQNKAMLPQQPVAVGEKWSNQTEVDLPFAGKIKTSLDCKLASVTKTSGSTIALVSWSGVIETKKPGKTDMGGVQITVSKMDVNQTGTAGFDTDKCTATNMTVDQTGKIDLVVSSSDGQTTPMRIDQKVKIVVATELAPPAR
jgi:hypothetical protein